MAKRKPVNPFHGGCTIEQMDQWGPIMDEMYGILCEARLEGRVVTVPLGELDDVKGKPNRQLIADFDYDYQAYSTVNRNLTRLIELGHLREAMELSQELMSSGSYQVEVSDEGMMTEDIEECVQIVIKAIAKSDLPAADVTAWCAGMTLQGRVGFICDSELAALAKKTKR